MNPLIQRVLRTPRGAVSAVVLAMVLVCAVFAPFLAPFDYAIQNLPAANTPPGAAHWLGTDEFGRDLLSRIIHGARTSLSVSLSAISISVVFGMSLGAAAGYFGGVFDRVVTAVVDLTWSFPEILIALILIAIIGTGTTSIIIALDIRSRLREV